MTDDVDIVPQGAIEIGAGVEFLQNAKFPLSGLKGDLTRVGDLIAPVRLCCRTEADGQEEREERTNAAGASANHVAPFRRARVEQD